MHKNLILTLISVSILTAGGAAHAATSIDAYLSAPDALFTSYAGTTVETFDALPAGTGLTSAYNSAIGTYLPTAASPMTVTADDLYGNGTGNYVSIGAASAGNSQAPITLNLATPSSYFGFSFCAGDVNNGVSFYSGNTLIGRFSTASILSLLSNSTVTAVNGTTYQSSQYYGKPNTTNVNVYEPYSFVNFFVNGGTFDRIVFDNTVVSGFSAFESDNHTVSAAAQTPRGDFVVVGSVTVPEANTALLAMPALGIVGMVILRRRKK